MFLKKLQWISAFMLNNAALEGGKHRKVWWSASNREVHLKTKDLGLNLGVLAAVNSALVRLQVQSGAFQVPVSDALAAEIYYLIKEMN
jgi:hypothetical protein